MTELATTYISCLIVIVGVSYTVSYGWRLIRALSDEYDSDVDYYRATIRELEATLTPQQELARNIDRLERECKIGPYAEQEDP